MPIKTVDIDPERTWQAHSVAHFKAQRRINVTLRLRAERIPMTDRLLEVSVRSLLPRKPPDAPRDPKRDQRQDDPIDRLPGEVPALDLPCLVDRS
jgi:hypothetical protein